MGLFSNSVFNENSSVLFRAPLKKVRKYGVFANFFYKHWAKLGYFGENQNLGTVPL